MNLGIIRFDMVNFTQSSFCVAMNARRGHTEQDRLSLVSRHCSIFLKSWHGVSTENLATAISKKGAQNSKGQRVLIFLFPMSDADCFVPMYALRINIFSVYAKIC
jgi:hypothetical protein